MADRTDESNPPVQAGLPTTYVERGASVAFTVPELTGTRLRSAIDGKREATVPSPSGRGIYVVPWRKVGSLCKPTVYDMQLIDGAARLPVITPHALRNLTLRIAAEGFAGRRAMGAAQDALSAAANVRLLTYSWLLHRLVVESEARTPALVPLARDTDIRIQQRSERAVAQLAQSLGCRADAVTQALSDMAERFAPLGVAANITDAYVPGMLAQLRAMRDGLRADGREADASEVDLRLIVAFVDFLLNSVSLAVREALASTERMHDLVRRWLADSAPFEKLIAQPEWLLDGWDRISALWRLHRAEPTWGLTMREIVSLLAAPLPLPSTRPEAGASNGLQRALLERQRSTVIAEDWRAGSSALDRIARNELLVAHAV